MKWCGSICVHSTGVNIPVTSRRRWSWCIKHRAPRSIPWHRARLRGAIWATDLVFGVVVFSAATVASDVFIWLGHAAGSYHLYALRQGSVEA